MHATIRLEGVAGHVNEPSTVVNPITTMMHLLRTVQARFADALQITSLDARNHANIMTPESATARIHIANWVLKEQGVESGNRSDEVIRENIDNLVAQCQKEFPGKVTVTY